MIDTIYALSSGRPPAGIAVIRISGPQAIDIHEKFVGSAAQADRTALLRALRHPSTAELLDRALTLVLRAPRSATGEDMVEWHCHGGQAIVAAVMAALASLGTVMPVRQALPGEFTRRALENGRIDLNEAEGLADLLAAQTDAQRRAALLMAEGHFSRRIEEWRIELLRLSALTEALLDFSDEDDVPSTGAEDELRAGIGALMRVVERHLAAPAAERLNEGIRVVLTGPRNAGKSTLLNALVGRDAAIVSDIAGTTRDRIDVPAVIDGLPFVLTDTAGLIEETDDVIERIGVERAGRAIEAADIVLWLGDPAELPRADAVCVAAKADLNDRAGRGDISLSALTGQGMAELRDLLVARASDLLPAEGEYALHDRQREALAAIAQALVQAEAEADLIIVAEHLRDARQAADSLSGRAGTEDMLDALFSRFCVGK